VVHPAPGHDGGTLVNALLAHCGESLSGIGGVKRPGIVHRLDKDTSGLLVVAKNDAAHQALSEQFAAHGRDGRLQREYLAFVWGVPSAPGTIATGIGRSTANRQKQAVSNRADAREAITHYDVVERLWNGGQPRPLPPRNGPHPPDPRAYGAYRPSAVGGWGLWGGPQVGFRAPVAGCAKLPLRP
jgi:23S rRNA pseudouridine1911/1915/1917 synthase